MSAQVEAARVEPGRPVRWRGLEVAAFEDHHGVLRQLDPDGKFNGGKRRVGRLDLKLAVVVPLAIVMLVVLGAPIWGFVTLLGDRFGRSNPDPFASIPTAGVIFAIGLPFLVISLILWLRAGATKDRAREVQAVAAMGLGTISVLIAAIRGSETDVPGWEAWTVPIAATALIGGAFTILLLRASRAGRVKKQEPEKPARITAVEPLKRVRLEVERLTLDQQQAVRRDLDAAIDDLADRSVISGPDAAWARGAELGKLALRMSQGRGPVATNPRGA